jgi:hypothetical protein
MECVCKIVRRGNELDIEHCPKHAEVDNLLAALAWAVPYLAEVPLPPDNQRHRDWYAKKLDAAEQAVRTASGCAA